MKLNGITCTGYAPKANEAAFELEGTTVEAVSALDGETLTVTDDEGATIETFAGYVIASIQVKGEGIRLRVVRKISDQTAEAIEGIEQGMASLATDMAAVRQAANPQLISLATIVVPTIAETITDERALSVSGFFPEYAIGVDYKQNDVFRYGGKLFRVAQSHTSQEQWVPGETGTESLYTEISVAGDGIDVWQQPTGAHDAYDAGDKVHYPDAQGPVYTSTVDGNTWSPEEYPQGWSIESDQE